MVLRKAIALCSDNGYLDKVTTTIKSICAHNRNIHFYIFSEDIPVEWFRIIEKKLQPLNSKITNVKLSSELLTRYQTRSHINYASFYRYFIADYTLEEKVLYLDSDIIVTDNLDDLFALELGEAPLAALDEGLIWPALTGSGFNSGVMLINTPYWRNHQTSEMLMSLTEANSENLHNGDQQILNIAFKDYYLPLDKTYNYLIGYDVTLFMEGYYDTRDRLENGLPKIVHYITHDKPWNHFSSSRLRSLWWYYYGLDWDDISVGKSLHPDGYNSLIVDKTHKPQILIYTSSGDLHCIEELIQSLPDFEFHIAAHTMFCYKVVELQRFENVTLYPGILEDNLQTLIEKCDFYLDIHFGYELDNMSQKMHELGKKVYTFENTIKSDRENYDKVCDSSDNLIQTLRVNY